MKKPIQLLIKAALAVFLGAALGLLFPGGNTPNTFEKLQRTTVLIDSDGWGSGVLVSRKGEDGHFITYVWTAGHVVQARPPATGLAPRIVVTINGTNYPVGVVAYSTRTNGVDVALLRVWQEDVSTESVRFVADDYPPKIGDPVYHLGNFYGDMAPSSLSAGIMAAVNRDFHTTVMDQICCPVYPGSSGGGVYLRNGRCIGLADARVDESIGIVTPIREIRRWAKNQGLLWALDSGWKIPAVVLDSAIPR